MLVQLAEISLRSQTHPRARILLLRAVTLN